MRSTSSSRSVIVGIFILIGIAILAVTILTLGGQRNTFTDSTVITSFYPNVNGLQKGNNIWFNGVKVGNIKSIEIIESGKVEVKMNIDKAMVQYIHKDAMARLSSDGFIGNKIVEIFGGTPGTPNVQSGDIIETQIQISTDEMMSTLSKNNDNILEITHNLKLVTSEIADGKGTVGMLLKDETLINQINVITASLARTSNNIENLSKAAALYTNRLNEPGSLANSLVSDTTIFNNLSRITDRLKSVADSSQMFMNNLNEAGSNFKNSMENSESALGVLLNDKATSDNLKSTLDNLESATQKLDEDLEALQHNFLFRRYFKKKAKGKLDKQKNQ